MPVTVVVGGQFGGEGKGKTVAHLSRNRQYDAVVRCGGPNSGHTVTINKEQVVLRQVPAGVVNPQTSLFLAAGCILDLNILSEEIEHFHLTPGRLRIDKNALILSPEYIEEEKQRQFDKNFGSTCTGTGIGVLNRILRGKGVKLARDIPSLKSYLSEVGNEIQTLHCQGRNIIVEGTQGYGLSLYHSPYYPFATSRDTIASSFLSEVGISPRIVSEIIMVLRTFPIRVGGNSGPLPNEISWKDIQEESNYPYFVQECTTVTKRLRRVARFDLELVKKANNANLPTQLAVMGLDYLDFENYNVRSFDQLTDKAVDFLSMLRRELRTKITLVGTGPTDNNIIDRIGSTEYEQQRGREREIKSAEMC